MHLEISPQANVVVVDDTKEGKKNPSQASHSGKKDKIKYNSINLSDVNA
jgi:hypothetical protein